METLRNGSSTVFIEDASTLPFWGPHGWVLPSPPLICSLWAAWSPGLLTQNPSCFHVVCVHCAICRSSIHPLLTLMSTDRERHILWMYFPPSVMLHGQQKSFSQQTWNQWPEQINRLWLGSLVWVSWPHFS